MKQMIDYIYPPRCPVCDCISPEGFCDSCRDRLIWIRDDFCMRCGKPLSDGGKEYCWDCSRKPHWFVQGRAMISYRGPVRRSLYRMKYANRKEYAKIYGAEMADCLEDWVRHRRIQVIVPIPLHRRRRRQRGYNQAAILARSMGRELGISVEEKILVRKRWTAPQKSVAGDERKHNLERAFEAPYEIPDNLGILLVDDIYTTGSTVDAAAKALLEAGNCRVYVATVAIGG